MKVIRRLFSLSVPAVVLVVIVWLLGADNRRSSIPSPQVPTVRSFGAIGDGKADDTGALQRAVDAGIGDVYLPRGIYRITKPILIDLDKVGPVSVVGSGTARIVMQGPGPAIKFIGTHQGTAGPHTVKANVWQRQRMPLVDGLEIVGAHEQAVGIEATGTMKLIITRLSVRKALHAIHLTVRNRNVIVSDCHLYENRGVGLFLDEVNLHQINVTGCHISYNAAGGIVVRGGNVRNLQVGSCDIEGNRFNVLLDSAGTGYGVAEVAVVGCTLQHSGGEDSTNIRFIGADDNDKRAWGHVTIADNVMSDVHMNIDIRKARDVSIVGNTLWTGYQYDLRVEDSSNVVIGPNVFGRNPKYRDEQRADCGLLLCNCEDATLNGLHIHGVRRARAGLILKNCRRMNVTGCTILDCDRAGILLENVSHSRVSGCLIRNDLAGAERFVPIQVVGGEDNMIVE